MSYNGRPVEPVAVIDRTSAEARSSAPPPSRALASRLVFVAPLFLLSGATALLYQVAFGKKLSTIFGATAYAVSAVLAAFMAGLALGSWLGGRYGMRVRRPLVVYGAAEVAVGIVCAVTPALFDAIASGYLALLHALPSSIAAVSAARAIVTAAVVLIPTLAMGITLPMLARALAADAEGALARQASRHRLGLLYGVNTAGGALGALTSAYLVIPHLGVYTTMRGAALVNVAIGLVAIAAGARMRIRTREHATGEAVRDEGEPINRRLLDVLALTSGVLVFAVEVVDTHLLALLIGNSAYAFGLMLAVFLTCLSVGAALAGPIERRLGPMALTTALFVAAGALLISLPVWGWLPEMFLIAGRRVDTWAGRELVRGAAACAALALPTTFMGVTFPLLLRRVAGRHDVAVRVGRLTAINTVGSIGGSLACGYLVLPWLGSEWSLRVIAVAFAAAAALAALWQGRQKAVSRAAFVGLAACAVAGLVMPRWDMKVMTNGANVYFEAQAIPDELSFVAEDVHGGFTTVARRGEVLTLYTNGKFQGDDGDQMVAQRSFAHFPAMFVRRFDRALVIGLGTGTTLGTIATYPFERIDVAEISPAIVQAATRYFARPNLGALQDPRVNVIVNDGRNLLLVASQPYDLITIELSSVWFAGAANLYSVEFYQLVKTRLAADGILQQWVQLHHIRREEVAVVLRTIRQAFEHVALFVSGGQGIVVASNSALLVSSAHLARLSARPAIRGTLHDGKLEPLLERLFLSGKELDRFIADSAGIEGAVVSTDENVYLEYATPKGNAMRYWPSLKAMVDLLATYRSADPVAAHLR